VDKRINKINLYLYEKKTNKRMADLIYQKNDHLCLQKTVGVA
jgi:hypothetical protein